jgi:hypothetical protein
MPKETLHLEWEDFVDQYHRKQIKTRVELAKGDELVRTGGLPSYWKMSRKIMKGITFGTAIAAILAFSFINPVAGLGHRGAGVRVPGRHPAGSQPRRDPDRPPATHVLRPRPGLAHAEGIPELITNYQCGTLSPEGHRLSIRNS